MSRVLPSYEYVDITVALSLFTQISTFLSSIIAITVGISKRESPNTKEKIQALQSFLFKAFLVLATVFLVLSPFITKGAHIPAAFVLPIVLMMLFSIPVTVISGYLNGINAMAKLGLVALISASSQFVIALIVAILTQSGLLSMLAMTIAQMITIFIIYRLFSSLDLPNIGSSLKWAGSRLISRKLMIYTALAAASIMLVSVAQIADLLILRNMKTTDIKFYTDIYVVSRIVFFAGMILIWPFLGQINISSLDKNTRPFLKLIGSFAAIGLVAIGGLLVGGGALTDLLFGSGYSLHLLQAIGTLSIIFKITMLIVTAATLYFIVMHRYIVVLVAFITSASLVTYGALVNQSLSTTQVLIQINIIGALIAATLVVLIIFEASSKNNTKYSLYENHTI
ncbi:MAG: hypothetical protein ABI303_01825 [Candidatus Saccharimonas sp.]